VCEEFKEHYLNKPYGDVWHKMRELAYTVHPYKWMTIGKELSHIENATLNDVKAFFFKHYRPINAIVVVAGNVKTEQVKNFPKNGLARWSRAKKPFATCRKSRLSNRGVCLSCTKPCRSMPYTKAGILPQGLMTIITLQICSQKSWAAVHLHVYINIW